jgi:rhodanese-related sulfurtransferase
MSQTINIKPEELQIWLANENAILIDVREFDEYLKEKIPGSINIPLSSFDNSKIPNTDKKIVFQCRSGKRSFIAAEKFFSMTSLRGYNLEGGIIAWKNLGFKVI